MKKCILLVIIILISLNFVGGAQPINSGSDSSINKETINLENDKLSLEFNLDNKIVQLSSVTNKKTAYTFEFTDLSIWKMKVFNIENSNLDFETSSYLAGPKCEKLNYEKVDLGSKETLNFIWKNCELAIGEFVDVELVVSLEEGEKNSKWRINVENNMNSHSIDYVTIPLKIKEDSSQDAYVVYPDQSGWLIKNPASTIKESKFVRSNGVQMQLFPYYTEDGNGLYMATNDPYGTYVKLQYWDADETSFTHEFGHYVENSAFPGNDLSMPYDVLVGIFEGDWYDAAKIYRQWAQTTPMLEKGKLKTRNDVPLWYKELDLFTITALQSFDNPTQRAERYNDAREFYGADNEIIFVWFWTDNPTGSGVPDYGEYTPANNLPEFINALNGYGIRSTVYSLIFAMDKNIPQWNNLKHTALLMRNGEMADPDGKGPNKGEAVVVDASHKDWQNQYIDLAKERFVSIGTTGNYFDNPYSTWLGDFNPRHTQHPLGMGGNYIYEGYADLMEKVRSAGREVNPNYVTFYEKGDEKYIRVSDTIIVTGIYDYPPIGNDVNCKSISLLSTVYHDYAVFISNPKMNYLIHGYTDYKDVTFTLAKSAILGGVPGVQEPAYELGLGMNYELGNYPGYQELGTIIANYAEFYKEIIAVRKMARDYLTYGELLRELPTNSKNVVKMFCSQDGTNPSNCQSSNQNRVYGKEVLNSVWKSYDGNLGFFFLNYNDDSKTITVNVDFSEYNLDGGTSYVLKKYTSDGKIVDVIEVDSDFSFTETFAPRSAVFYTLTEGIIDDSSDENSGDNSGSSGGGNGGGSGGNSVSNPPHIIKNKVEPIKLETPKNNEKEGEDLLVTSRREEIVLNAQRAVFAFLSGLVGILVITGIIIYVQKGKLKKKEIH